MKLGRFAILMIGIFVAVVALSWGFFMKYIPNKKEKDLLDANTQLNNDEAAKMGTANQRVAKAKKLVDQKGREWTEIVATRTPPSTLKEGGIDLSVDAWQLSVDYPKFRDSIQKAVNAQVKKGGVTVVSAPEVTLQTDVPANQILSAVFNYPALPGKFPIVMYDFGTITVQGTYKQIMDNVRAYKNMPHYLAVADGLRLDGTSPNLTGTYSLSIVGFIRAKTIAPPVNEGVATASAGGAGGLFGGPGGGMPGPGGPGGLGGPRNPGGRGGGAGRAGGRGPVSAGTGGGD